MNRLWLVLITLLPFVAFAQGTNDFSFAPPETDLSIKLLGYIFGLVDGVLYGTGSQIVGEMFGIFNAAVLALGAIVISYTTMVSIVNTAHQGTVLGKKWSSVMVPLRSVFAVGLLIPKASGYCSIQIFVMWVVVQGVGAADAIWNQALGYLARGGVLVDSSPMRAAPSADQLPEFYSGLDVGPVTNAIKQLGREISATYQNSLGSSTDDTAPPLGDKTEASANILRSLICMHSLEKILRQKAAILASVSGTQIAQVPAFINYVNTMDSDGEPLEEILLPPSINDPTNGAYYDFRGVCGQIRIQQFSEIDKMAENLAKAGLTGLYIKDSSGNDVVNRSHPLLRASINARNIAVQQMIMELSATASSIVENVYTDPADDTIKLRYDSLGFWVTESGTKSWVGSTARDTVPLLNGYELINSVNAYIALVRPTLRLTQDSLDSNNYIKLAREQGWILAGSYFYDLVKATDAAKATQFKVGSIQSNFSYNLSNLTGSSGCTYTSATSSGSSGPCRINYTRNGQPETAMLSTSDILDSATPLGLPSYWGNTGSHSDKVERYISAALTSQETQNSSAGVARSPVRLELPSVPYLGSPILSCSFDISDFFPFPNPGSILKAIGRCIAYGFEILARLIGDRIIDLVNWIIIPPVSSMFFTPLQSMDTIFNSGLAGSYEPGRNPIIELTKTGNVFMTLSVNIIFGLLIWGLISLIVSPFVGAALAVFLVIAPIFLIICIAIFSYGIILAFYVPLIPYIIFTFASIGWFVAVIEAMVAAPIVALGLAHPEGHDALGKADSAVLLLVNVFLRPALLVMGFVLAIIFSYVVITLFNAGFLRVNQEMIDLAYAPVSGGLRLAVSTSAQGFSGFLAPLFMITVYMAVYLQLVEKSFELIYILPDQVISWIGGQKQDSSGRMAAGATSQMKQDVSKTAATGQKIGKAATGGAKKMGKLGGKAAKAAKSSKGGSSGGGGKGS